MFEKADRTDPVEASGNVTIIHQFETHTVGQASFLGPLLAESDLVRRESDAGDFHIVMACEVEREPTPAAPDIENSLARLHVHLGG